LPGLSDHEERDTDGQVVIYLKGNNHRALNRWLVLGKYAEPRPDGNQYFVADRRNGWLNDGPTFYFDDLLMAVCYAAHLKEEFDNDYV